MLQKIGLIKGFEPTFLSDTRRKWILVTTKLMKPRVQASFDEILTQYSIPMNTLHPPGRVSKHINNTDMMSYATMLTQDTTLYDLNKNIPPKSSLKRNFSVSYDINATIDFPNISNTKKNKKIPNTKYTNTRRNGKYGCHINHSSNPLTKTISPHSLMKTTK